MKATYRALAGLVCLLVLVQAASIAYGAFDVFSFVGDGDNAYTDSSDVGGAGLAMHSIGAMAVAVVALVLLVVSFFARIDGGVTWAAAVLGTVVLQWAFAIVAFSAPVVGLLHGITAFVIFGLAMTAMQRAKAAQDTPATTTA